MDEYSKFETNKEIPQICLKTGISKDYSNQFSILMNYFLSGGVDNLKVQLKKRPRQIGRYEEIYSGYKNIVNDQNRNSIKRLDDLALYMNNLLKDPESIDKDDFLKTYNEMNSLVYGDPSETI